MRIFISIIAQIAKFIFTEAGDVVAAILLLNNKLAFRASAKMQNVLKK
jgi:hypothetical protein